MSFEGAAASTGGLSPDSVQNGGKRSAWLNHVMAVKKANPKLSLGQAMKKAKGSYKKTGGGGPMEGKMSAGGRRTRRRGGALYGFGGGDGDSGSSAALADGAGAYGTSRDATWKPSGGSSLTGSPSTAPAAGGRRTRRRHRRRNNKKGTASGGKRRR